MGSSSNPTARASPTSPHGCGTGRLRPVVGTVRPLAEAVAAFTPDKRTPGRTIIRVAED
ncbi:hypothetical protein ACFY0B_13870 [Streptomyces sp. NPDC001797]|uniref:hypothetical protein n=1 Tax=Streptomyces sp. NPDC001797 TaxID=3364610 RepID=UPI0036870EFB